MEDLDFDFKKITEEDRRFLLNKNLSHLISNEHGRAGNVSLIISGIAVLIAMFTIVIQTKNLVYYLIYANFVLFSVILLLNKHKLVNKLIDKENTQLRKEFDKLFCLHFKYAQNSK